MSTDGRIVDTSKRDRVGSLEFDQKMLEKQQHHYRVWKEWSRSAVAFGVMGSAHFV
jgi:hypothetical protein